MTNQNGKKRVSPFSSVRPNFLTLPPIEGETIKETEQKLYIRKQEISKFKERYKYDTFS